MSLASHSCRHASQLEQTNTPVRSVVALARVQAESHMPPRFKMPDFLNGPEMDPVFFGLVLSCQPMPVDANLAHQVWGKPGLREVKAAFSCKYGCLNVFGSIHFLYFFGSAINLPLVIT